MTDTEAIDSCTVRGRQIGVAAVHGPAPSGLLSEEVARFVRPSSLYSRGEVLAKPTPAPNSPGVYGWWFRKLPAAIDVSDCCTHDGLTLLYVGISPAQPPANGKPASSENLSKRIRYHYTGNAEGSTLRKTLGCLVADDLGLQLRRVGSGKRRTFAQGESVLDAWMQANAFVSWLVRERPWELEDELIAKLSLPLNLRGNSRHSFYEVLTRTRATSHAQADLLPILPNPVSR